MSKSNYLEDSSEFYDVDVEDTEEKSEEENLQEKIMSGEIKESDLVEYRSLDLDGLDLSGQDILADEEDEDEDSLYSPDERLRILSDNIISACIDPSKSIYNYAIDKLTVVSNPRLFRDDLPSQI